MSNSWLTFRSLCVAAFVLRVVLLIYGEWQDAHFTVKYTDIDYIVFTDAARYITQGLSPYERATYRYTPLLAIMLTPNIYLFRAFGKCVFALADLAVGYLIHRILLQRGLPTKKALWLDALWLLNPMVANISTRGNAESLLGVMVLGTLYLVMLRRFYPACFLFGLAVHFKIYPVIYAIPILFLMDEHYGDPVEWPQMVWTYQQARLRCLQFYLQDHDQSDGCRIREPADQTDANRTNALSQNTSCIAKTKRVINRCVLFLSPTRIMFGLVSAAAFFGITWFMYQMYGDEFLEHTYLYHITRKDHRHNFSVWFYQMYLAFDASIMGKMMGLMAFLPQLLLVAIVGIAFAKDIFFACFIQTFIFVTFNKVCTSQYFMWYLCLFPLILPSTALHLKWKGLALILAWVAGQVRLICIKLLNGTVSSKVLSLIGDLASLCIPARILGGKYIFQPLVIRINLLCGQLLDCGGAYTASSI
ncbi:PIG-M-domain-containing protein [Radiomyces spectabilis]|uniref:PIG-M-domain-containing protein n=1 Tax=Radiomyces spectabilis TaxID=64574 RepID=UPI00221FF13D|nr:PIG-M-domain-containing protein [Radiomyces spectabilis]KAI8372826.1 PIG-M-domain-containing protein [Radiomyces spectabilis]